MSFVVGLTGGIGSGKSTVADLFASLGAAVVDTDAIAHELTGPQGAAMPEIAAAFGSSVLLAEGGLDRVAMRHLVFSDPSVKSRLEAILHSMIRRESVARCRSASGTSGAPYVLLVVPLLLESGAYRELVDRILVVDCDEAVQISRVMARSGLAAGEIRAIMATQASRAERLAVADDVVSNAEGREGLSARVAALNQRYLELASAITNADTVNANC
ncbi:dephospho-CoA kinase [Propionivibrio sp.]|uniref:dephospho-CoA kinase n=1 Tax=Propionivibrio sp. TaxID=2212460 RepID=UPI003BF42DD6